MIGAKIIDKDNQFFNKRNTDTLRGFWYLIVMLIDVPIAYQNKVQDMIGSFAYIGVTFFFMTLAYGLRLSIKRKNINSFWNRRLPKLLIPCLIANIISIIFDIIKGSEIDILNLISINEWVLWLLVCYFIFFISYKFIRSGYQDLAICILIMTFSIVVYIRKGWINQTTWCPEIYGFIWGIIFYRTKGVFFERIINKWIKKSLFLFILAGLLGISYLKLKTVVFFGDYLLKNLLGVSITVFMLAVNARVSIGNRITYFLGSISYEIYLLHGVVYSLIDTMIPSLASGTFIILNIFITVVLSTIAHLLSKLFMGLLNEKR